MLQTHELSNVSWDCIHFLDSDTIPALEGLIAANFKVFEIDAGRLTTKEELLRAVAAAMQFPDYFSANWDALEECLRDMTWSPANGYLLIAWDSEPLWRHNPRIAAGLLNSWLFSAKEWARQSVPFHLIFSW